MNRARIIVLVIAIAAGALAALLASGGGEPTPVAEKPNIETVDVLVAKTDIGTGRVLNAEDVDWMMWPVAGANAQFIRRDQRPEAIKELAGSIVRVALIAGEPVRESRLIKGDKSGFLAAMLPSGMRAISVEVAPETGAGGFILPNDRVDVILTRKDEEARQQRGYDVFVSETLMRNVQVLAIDQAVEEKDGQRVVIGKTATLELNPGQAERLSLARQQGTISLALRALVDAKEPRGGGDDDRNRRAGINTVRFGVTTTSTPR